MATVYAIVCQWTFAVNTIHGTLLSRKSTHKFNLKAKYCTLPNSSSVGEEGGNKVERERLEFAQIQNKCPPPFIQRRTSVGAHYSLLWNRGTRGDGFAPLQLLPSRSCVHTSMRGRGQPWSPIGGCTLQRLKGGAGWADL